MHIMLNRLQGFISSLLLSSSRYIGQLAFMRHPTFLLLCL